MMPINYALLQPYEQFFRPGFIKWLTQNEHIYSAFQEQVFRLINGGRTHFSARTIVEEMRHYSRIKESGGEFKINDHRSPDLARVFVVLHPQYVKFWEYRRSDWQEFLSALGIDPETKRPRITEDA